MTRRHYRTLLNRLLTPALFALPLVAQADPGGTPPRFEDFPEKSRFVGRPAAPILDTPFARKFRTVLRRGASQGPNFAGHFTVVEWGCGGGCRQLAIVDAKSGKVIPMPFATMVLPATAEPVPDETGDSPHEEYRLDSRLLVLVGCRDEDPARCGTHYFLMEGMALQEPPWNEGKRPPGPRETAGSEPAGSGHGGGAIIAGDFNTGKGLALIEGHYDRRKAFDAFRSPMGFTH